MYVIYRRTAAVKVLRSSTCLLGMYSSMLSWKRLRLSREVISSTSPTEEIAASAPAAATRATLLASDDGLLRPVIVVYMGDG